MSPKNNLLKGADVLSVQAKFDEMFAPKVEVKEEKPKKVAKKRVAEKKGKNKKAAGTKGKTAVKKPK